MAQPVAVPSPASGQQPPYDPQRELRLAVVMYGGVSLAIYMYGVAEELHRLVRSTAPDADDRGALRTPTSTEVVYREVARLLDSGDASGATAAPAVRFVVDIIAGTSAGGINGICLAKALVNDAELTGLKDIWVNEGDIGRLIADQRSAMEGTESLFEWVRPPASLLSGPRMQRRLVDALAGMEREGAPPSPLVDELDLWVTSTDLEGLPVALRLANGTAYESRHANRFCFRYSPHEDVDDFGSLDNPFLAYAARSTSAFPFAFDPARLEVFRPVGMGDADWEAAKERWRRFHRHYPTAAKPPFPGRFFSDGGILDNKPFSSATGTLVERRAELPVTRKLVYVEPDPVAGPDTEREIRDFWNIVDTAQAAALRIPQIETIAEDLGVVQRRNRDIERMRDIVGGIGLGTERQRLEDVVAAGTSAEWGQRSFEDLAGDERWGVAYGVYHRLKVRGVVDWLAWIFIRRQGFDPQSDQALAVHQLARAYKDIEYGDDTERGPGRTAQFLLDFDLPYRLRRIDFVLQKLKELTGGDADARTRAAKISGLAEEPSSAEIQELRAGLSRVRAGLAGVERTLGETMGDLGITGAALGSILDGHGDADMAARARALVEENEKVFSAAGGTVREVVAEAARVARAEIDSLLGPMRTAPDLRGALRFYYDAFEAHDVALYPLGYGTALTETNPVDIVRISPRDAELLQPEGGRPALKGAALHHFGAFLDQGWREHDIVWGRLDAAECLITSLLGRDHPRREELVGEAHRAIAADYARDKEEQPEDVVGWFVDLPFNKEPDRETTGEALSRGEQVVSWLLRDIVEKRGGKPSKVLVPVIETTLGDEPRSTAVRALVGTKVGLAIVGAPAVLIAAGVVLLAVGAPVGWALIGAGAALLAVVTGGLFIALAKLRGAVRKASINAIYPPKQASPAK